MDKVINDLCARVSTCKLRWSSSASSFPFLAYVLQEGIQEIALVCGVQETTIFVALVK